MENSFFWQLFASSLEINTGVNYQWTNVRSTRSPAHFWQRAGSCQKYFGRGRYRQKRMGLNIITIQAETDGFIYHHYGLRN